MACTVLAPRPACTVQAPFRQLARVCWQPNGLLRLGGPGGGARGGARSLPPNAHPCTSATQPIWPCLHACATSPPGPQELTKEDFPLPTLGPKLVQIRDNALFGLGFQLIKSEPSVVPHACAGSPAPACLALR